MAKLVMNSRVEEYVAPPPEGLVNDDPRMLDGMEVGDVSHQGDLILVRIQRLPHERKRRESRQLADGSTQGSRHVMTRGDVFDCERSEVAQLIQRATRCEVGFDYVGPVFVSPQDPTADDLQHPEHGNQGFPAGAVIACVYQRVLDDEQQERRSID